MGYSYFDTPDGEDCFKKIWFTTKISTLIGLSASMFDVILYSHPKGYLPTIGRIASFAVPAACVGATFSAITYMSTNIRKKDDHWNHVIGGLVAGTIIGVRTHSFAVGSKFCALFAVAGHFNKVSQLEDWPPFFPSENKKFSFGTMHHPYYDFTLTKAPKDAPNQEQK